MVVKEITNTYLESNGINTKRLNRLFVYEKNGMYYVEIDYLSDAYRIVFNNHGDAIIPIEKIKPFYSKIGITNYIFLDENNLLLPIMTEEVVGQASNEYPPNLYEHLKFTPNGYRISEIFTSFPRTNERLLRNKILISEGKLYNFSTDEYLNNEAFERIFLEDSFDLRTLALTLGYEVPSLTSYSPKNDLEEFILSTREKLLDHNLVIGYKQENNSHILSFIDMNGNVLESIKLGHKESIKNFVKKKIIF